MMILVPPINQYPGLTDTHEPALVQIQNSTFWDSFNLAVSDTRQLPILIDKCEFYNTASITIPDEISYMSGMVVNNGLFDFGSTSSFIMFEVGGKTSEVRYDSDAVIKHALSAYM